MKHEHPGDLAEKNIDPMAMLRLITESEQHFNNLCFKIRSLASTWLLATFAGVGFVLTKQGDFVFDKSTISILICWAGAIGVLVLWVLDLQLYQRLLNAWFEAREDIETRHPEIPQMHTRMSATQPDGRAANRIKIYYLTTCSAPLLFALATAIKTLSSGVDTTARLLLVISLVLFIGCTTLINRFSIRDSREPGHEGSTTDG